MTKKLIYIIIILGFFAQRSAAQDPHFSQFYANPLYLSPSLAGATDGGRIAMNYRNQWPAISKAFSTYSFSFDNFFTSFNSGIGFYLLRDQAGSAGLSTTNAAFQYSYNLLINDEWQIIPGIQFEFANKSIDFSKLELGYENETGGGSSSWERLTNESVNYFDLAASLFLYNSKYWIGFTLNHLSKPNYSFLNEQMKMPVKGVVFGGMNIWTQQSRKQNLNRSFSWSFRYQQQAEFKQLDLGINWYNYPLELGFWYRGLPVFNNVKGNINQDALVAILAYNYGPYRFGYSYDITLSGLGWQTAGAHELSIIYEFNQRFNLRMGGKRPAVPCSSTANSQDAKKYSKKQRRIF
jgi:type IX secretion system PorP/SprF family membrane protein